MPRSNSDVFRHSWLKKGQFHKMIRFFIIISSFVGVCTNAFLIKLVIVIMANDSFVLIINCLGSFAIHVMFLDAYTSLNVSNCSFIICTISIKDLSENCLFSIFVSSNSPLFSFTAEFTVFFIFSSSPIFSSESDGSSRSMSNLLFITDSGVWSS